MNMIPKYYCPFIKEMTGWVMTARMIREKMNLRYFSIDDSGISMRKKRQRYYNEKKHPLPIEAPDPSASSYLDYRGNEHDKKKQGRKNIIAPIEMTQLPISFNPADIFESVIGSARAPVIL